MRYYLVDAQFSHVSQNGFIIKTVPTAALDRKGAAFNVRRMPRVKHHEKNAILDVREVTKEEYDYYVENVFKNDPYFKVTNRQEQNRLCPDVYENIYYYRDLVPDKKTNKRDNVGYKIKKYRLLEKECCRTINAYSY